MGQKVSTEDDARGPEGALRPQIVADYRGVSTLSSWGPVAVQGLHWIVVAQQDEAEALAPVDGLRHSILVVAALAAVILTAISVALASVFTRPIQAVLAGVNTLAAGDESVRIPVKGRDEFADLARAFNRHANEIAERSARIEQKTVEYEQLLQFLSRPHRRPHPQWRGRLLRACAQRLRGGPHHRGFRGLVRGGSGETLERVNAVVGDLDELCTAGGLEKIRTIGETYMAACGLSTPRLDAAQRAWPSWSR